MLEHSSTAPPPDHWAVVGVNATAASQCGPVRFDEVVAKNSRPCFDACSRASSKAQLPGVTLTACIALVRVLDSSPNAAAEKQPANSASVRARSMDESCGGRGARSAR